MPLILQILPCTHVSKHQQPHLSFSRVMRRSLTRDCAPCVSSRTHTSTLARTKESSREQKYAHLTSCELTHTKKLTHERTFRKAHASIQARTQSRCQECTNTCAHAHRGRKSTHAHMHAITSQVSTNAHAYTLRNAHARTHAHTQMCTEKKAHIFGIPVLEENKSPAQLVPLTHCLPLTRTLAVTALVLFARHSPWFGLHRLLEVVLFLKLTPARAYAHKNLQHVHASWSSG